MLPNINGDSAVAITVGHPVEVGLALRIRCRSHPGALDPDSLDLIAQIRLTSQKELYGVMVEFK